MSADGLTLDHDIVSIARDLQVDVYLHMLAIAIIFYDHCITLGSEIENIWSRPKRKSSYLFFLNRYFAFLANLSVTIMRFLPLSESSCLRYHLFRQVLLIVSQVLVCYLLSLRIYALYQRSRVMAAIMLCSAGTLAGVACFVMFGQKSAPAPMRSSTGCNVGISKITAIRLAGAWEALVTYDSLIVGLTLWRTVKERRDRRITGVNVTLVDILLRDGAMYYAVMALCNLANIMTFYFTGPFLRGSLSTFASGMSATMISRLMLNLHSMANEGIYTTQVTNTQFQYAKFQPPPLEGLELDTLWSSRGQDGDPNSSHPEDWDASRTLNTVTGSDLTAVPARHRRPLAASSDPLTPS